MDDYKCAAMNLPAGQFESLTSTVHVLECFGGAENAAANRHVAASAHGAPVSAGMPSVSPSAWRSDGGAREF
jgi:hypothetical protein